MKFDISPELLLKFQKQLSVSTLAVTFSILLSHLILFCLLFSRIPLLIELGRLCLEHNKCELAADCLENLKGGVKVTVIK